MNDTVTIEVKYNNELFGSVHEFTSPGSEFYTPIQTVCLGVETYLNNLKKDLPYAYSPDPIDLSVTYSHMFSAASKKGMARHVEEKRPSRKLDGVDGLIGKGVTSDVVHYFSIKARGAEKIVKAARMVTDDINLLSSKGFVTGTLMRLSCFKLDTQPHELDSYIVSCFISVTLLGDKWLEDNQLLSDHPAETSNPPKEA